MPAQVPEPDEAEAAAAGSRGAQRFVWVPGSVGRGPVPLAGVVPADEVPVMGGVPGGGRARVLDWQALLEALAAGGLLDGQEEDQDDVLAGELAAEQDGRMGAPWPPGELAGLAVEYMAPGPAMAGWLYEAVAGAGGLDESGLVGAIGAARQLASWAQAGELAVVARLAAACAAADPDVGVHADGRPRRVCRDAIGQVALALGLSDYAAAARLDLAVTLAWRLRVTWAALWAGQVDLYRARLIAEATSVLGEDAARAVEAQVLPGAGGRAPADLRQALRKEVIAVDPRAAEERRADAERQAAVSLYPDQDGTATLAGTKLPQVQAAAAMAKITAIAAAMKAAGTAGGLNLLRAQAMIGLLLGTLPYIPPADGAPPDDAPPDGAPPDSAPPDSAPPDGAPRNETGPGQPSPSEDPGAGGAGPCPGELAPARDEDAPPDDGLDTADDGWGSSGDGYWDRDGADGDDGLSQTGPLSPWPALGTIPPALAGPTGRTGPPDGRPVPGLLDVTLPWTTWAGLPGGGPGMLGRIGPITPAQARELARAAETDPAAQWRIIITDPAGHAITVTRLRHPAPLCHPARLARPRPGRATAGWAQPSPTASKHPSRPKRPGQRARAGRPDHPDHQPRPDPAGQPGQPGQPDRRPRVTAASGSCGAARGGGRAAGRPDPSGRGCGSRRVRPHRGIRGLPPAAAAARTRRGPRRHLPLPHLPAARVAGRPRPHRPLRPGRTDLHMRPGRQMPQTPHPQTAPQMEPRTKRAGRVHLDHTSRPQVHRGPRQASALNEPVARLR